MSGARAVVQSIRDGGLADTINLVPYMQGYKTVEVTYEYVVKNKDVDRYLFIEPHVTDIINIGEDLQYFPDLVGYRKNIRGEHFLKIIIRKE